MIIEVHRDRTVGIEHGTAAIGQMHILHAVVAAMIRLQAQPGIGPGHQHCQRSGGGHGPAQPPRATRGLPAFDGDRTRTHTAPQHALMLE
ncbi:hypothetical protein D3C73_1531050 [compost metagenome]